MSLDNAIINESDVAKKHTFASEEDRKKFDLFNDLLGNIGILQNTIKDDDDVESKQDDDVELKQDIVEQLIKLDEGTKENHFKLLIQKSPYNLKLVPLEYQTLEMVKNCVEKDWYCLSFALIQNEEICKIAFDQSPIAIQFFHSEFQTPEYVEKVCNLNRRNAMLINNKTVENAKIIYKHFQHYCGLDSKPSWVNKVIKENTYKILCSH